MVALRCEIRHCMAYGPRSTTDDYAYYIQKASGLLMEDNVSSNAGTTILIIGAQGCVFSYNYATNVTGSPGWMQGGLCTHGGNPNMNLFEGNVMPGLWLQNCWGSSEFNTAFRNRFIGQDPPNMGPSGVNQDVEAVQVGKIQ